MNSNIFKRKSKYEKVKKINEEGWIQNLKCNFLAILKYFIVSAREELNSHRERQQNLSRFYFNRCTKKLTLLLNSQRISNIFFNLNR